MTANLVISWFYNIFLNYCCVVIVIIITHKGHILLPVPLWLCDEFHPHLELRSWKYTATWNSQIVCPFPSRIDPSLSLEDCQKIDCFLPLVSFCCMQTIDTVSVAPSGFGQRSHNLHIHPATYLTEQVEAYLMHTNQDGHWPPLVHMILIKCQLAIKHLEIQQQRWQINVN